MTSWILTASLLAVPTVAAPTPQSVPIDLGAEQVVDLPVLLDAGGDSRHVYRDEEDGTLLAMGAMWKASFDSDGATFVPFLGSHASRNYPIEFRVAELLIGGEAAPLAAGEVESLNDRISIDRGAVRSEYVLAPSGVEQLFVVPKVDAPGDLVLSVAVETELSAVPDGAGWLFEGPEGGARYGAAFALDAKGKRLDLETTFDGEFLRFKVSSEFVQSAAWPLVIDPLITSLNVDLGGRDQLEADVAFDPRTDQYLVVFQEVFSSSDSDIKSILVDETGSLVPGSTAYISLGTRDTRRPRVACSSAYMRFLTVYVLHDPAGLPLVIRARYRNTVTGALMAPLLIDAPTGARPSHADVASDFYHEPEEVIVWQRELSPTTSEIVAKVSSQIHGLGGERIVAGEPGVRFDQPSLNAAISFPENFWRIVFRRHDPASGLSDIYVVTTDISNQPGTSRRLLSGPAPGNYSNPAVSGVSYGFVSSGQAIAVWEEEVAPSDRDLIGAAFLHRHAGVTYVSRPYNLSKMENVDEGLDQYSPALATLSDRVVLSYASTAPGRSDADIRTSTLNILNRELGITEAHEGLESTARQGWAPRVASTADYGGTTGEFTSLTVFPLSDTLQSQRDIAAALHAAPPEPCVGVQHELCVGQPNSTGVGAYVYAESSNQGLPLVKLRADRLPPFSFGYFLVSRFTSIGVIPQNSGTLCLVGPIGRYSLSVLNSGATGQYDFTIDLSSISQPNGYVTPLSGETWFFQAWHRDAIGGVVVSNFTNSVGILIP